MGKLDYDDLEFIRTNWHCKTMRELARILGVSEITINKRARQLGLPKKLSISKAEHKRLAVGDIDFEQMVNVLIQELQTLYKHTGRKLDALQKTPDPTLEERVDINNITKQASKLAKHLRELEQLRFDLEKMKAADRPNDEPHDFEDLMEYLDKQDAREREGRMLALIDLSMNNIEKDWATNLLDFGETTDVAFLSPNYVEEIEYDETKD